MANYEADFHFNKNTMDFNCEFAKNSVQADLILQYKPDKLSQLYNDVGFITKEVNNLTFYMRASDIRTALNTKVDKVTGKGLSTNDFTNAYKAKLDGIEAGAQVNKVNSVNGMTGNVVIDIPDSAIWGNITGILSNQTDLQQALNGKQATISDLSTIRSGASKGATAIQPNDNISLLNNNANYTSVYESTVSGWGFTKNTGTVTSVNNVSPVSGNVTLSIPTVDQTYSATSANAQSGVAINSAGFATEQYVDAIVGDIETILASI